MSSSKISEILLVNGKDQYSSSDTIKINVQFSIEGEIPSMKLIGQRHTTIMMSLSS